MQELTFTKDRNPDGSVLCLWRSLSRLEAAVRSPFPFRQKVWLTQASTWWLRENSAPTGQTIQPLRQPHRQNKICFQNHDADKLQDSQPHKKTKLCSLGIAPVKEVTAEFMPSTRTPEDFQQVAGREHSPCQDQQSSINTLPRPWTLKLGFLTTYTGCSLLPFGENLYKFRLQ